MNNEISIHDKRRIFTAFQHWLGGNYNDLPTDSDNMTERAIRYLKENPRSLSPIIEKAQKWEDLKMMVSKYYTSKDKLGNEIPQEIPNGDFQEIGEMTCKLLGYDKW